MELNRVCPGMWDHGAMGVSGLNVANLVLVAERIGIEADEFFFAKLKAFEGAALGAMNPEGE